MGDKPRVGVNAEGTPLLPSLRFLLKHRPPLTASRVEHIVDIGFAEWYSPHRAPPPLELRPIDLWKSTPTARSSGRTVSRPGPEAIKPIERAARILLANTSRSHRSAPICTSLDRQQKLASRRTVAGSSTSLAQAIGTAAATTSLAFDLRVHRLLLHTDTRRGDLQEQLHQARRARRRDRAAGGDVRRVR